MGQQHTQIAGPVSIVAGDAAFYKDIQQLCHERYGTGYLHRDDFVHWMEHPRLLKIALLDGVFAGFAVMIPASVGLVMKKMDMPRADILRISGEKPSLIYKSAAVQKRFERRGIMKAMADAGLREARAEGFGAVYGSAWVCNGALPIEGTFRAFGFQRLYERKMLWYDDPDYHCVVCGGRCTCDAVIYYKKL